MEQQGTITILDKETRKLKTYDVHSGAIVATEGSLVPDSNFAYSVEIGSLICSMLREGQTIKQVGETAGMPNLHLIYAWKNFHPDFKLALKEAREDRADYFHDKAVDAVDEVAEKDDVPVGNFKFNSYMKLAEKNSPDRYGNKVQHSGAGGGALQIVVNTGIIRDKEQPITVENDDGRDGKDYSGQQVCNGTKELDSSGKAESTSDSGRDASGDDGSSES